MFTFPVRNPIVVGYGYGGCFGNVLQHSFAWDMKGWIFQVDLGSYCER